MTILFKTPEQLLWGQISRKPTLVTLRKIIRQVFKKLKKVSYLTIFQMALLEIGMVWK